MHSTPAPTIDSSTNLNVEVSPRNDAAIPKIPYEHTKPRGNDTTIGQYNAVEKTKSPIFERGETSPKLQNDSAMGNVIDQRNDLLTPVTIEALQQIDQYNSSSINTSVLDKFYQGYNYNIQLEDTTASTLPPVFGEFEAVEPYSYPRRHIQPGNWEYHSEIHQNSNETNNIPLSRETRIAYAYPLHIRAEDVLQSGEFDDHPDFPPATQVWLEEPTADTELLFGVGAHFSK